MTPIAQQTAIARTQGWHSFAYVNTPDGPELWGATPRYKPTSLPTLPVPNYPEDLNAMHEVEESLSDDQLVEQSDVLYDLACLHQRQTGKWRYLSMPANLRAEAYLKVRGLWVGETTTA
jgi:hypothetical protein